MLFPDMMKGANPMTWDDVGCDFGERLSVLCGDGRTFTGLLVDFEVDFDGTYGGDSVSLRLDDGRCVSFCESEIANMTPAFA